MAYPLAPHLHHAPGSAWFEPLTLVSHLPARLSTAGDEEKRIYLHEYVHYLQAVTSFYGANRLHHFLRLLRFLQEAVRAAGGRFSALDRAAFAERLAQHRQLLDLLTADHDVETQPRSLKTHEKIWFIALYRGSAT